MVIELDAENRRSTAQEAAKHRTLDDACALVQDRIGQTDGGVAGQFFCGPLEDEYPDADYARRVEIMVEYIGTEMIYA